MKILNLLSFVFLIVLGSSGRVQDTREEAKDKYITHVETHVKSLKKDSISHAVFRPIHDTVISVHDSIIIQKKTIVIPITIPLTTAESLWIGRIEYPIINKMVRDSLLEKIKRNKGQIKVVNGLKEYDK